MGIPVHVKRAMEMLWSLEQEGKILFDRREPSTSFRNWQERASWSLKEMRLRTQAERFEGLRYQFLSALDPYQRVSSTVAEQLKLIVTLREDMIKRPDDYSDIILHGEPTPDQQKSVKGKTKAKKRTSVPVDVEAAQSRRPAGRPQRVFLGHGRSLLYASVQRFLEKEFLLTVDEFSSEPRAGHYTGNILVEFLHSCTFAVIVVTAEDETATETLRARQNVIHEIGLFQGKLGFEKVAILQQEGVEWLSNLHGLQTLQFKEDDISAINWGLMRMMEREGVVPKGHGR